MITIKAGKTNEWRTYQQLCGQLVQDNSQYDKDVLVNWTQTPKGINFFKNFTKDKQNCLFFAYDGDKPVGYIACVHKEPIYRRSKYLEIDNMEVRPDYRSLGIGSRLIEKAIRWAKANGYQKMFVNSYIKNVKAVNFYKKNGFAEIDISLEKNV